MKYIKTPIDEYFHNISTLIFFLLMKYIKTPIDEYFHNIEFLDLLLLRNTLNFLQIPILN
jgi:hypothetical protein